MQIVGENVHEMPNPVFWEKQEKVFNMSSAEILTQHAQSVTLENGFLYHMGKLIITDIYILNEP